MAESTIRNDTCNQASGLLKRHPSIMLQGRRTSNQRDNDERVSVRNSLIAGSCAGITSTLGLYPLDVLRTKMQTSVGHGPVHVLRSTIQHGRISALYTGLTMPLMAQIVYKGTVFTINNMTQQFLVDHRTFENHKVGKMENARLTLTDRFWGGLVGGAVNAALFVTPVEFVRNQMIAHHSKIAAGETVSYNANGTWSVIKHSLRQQRGVLSLWRGTSWAIYRDSIGCGCFFYTMAYCQQSLTPPGETPTFSSTVLSGGLAGLAYWVSALPLDTVKTWVQSSDVAASTLSATNSVRLIYDENGFRVLIQRLYRGWQVAYTRGIPSAAITMTTYSFVYKYLSGVDSFTK